MKLLRYLITLFCIVNYGLYTYSQCNLTEAVDFETTDIHGDTIQLFDILENKRQFVLIDFFYADCEPCQRISPILNEAFEYFGCGDFDVQFISISDRDSNFICHQFDQDYGVNFTTISGIEGKGDSIADLYGIQSFPTIILIDSNHSILEQDLWPVLNSTFIINPLESHGISQNNCIDYSITAGFSSDNNIVCAGNSIVYENTSTGIIEEFNWIFEGGHPNNSTEENPRVTYDTAGWYDASLIISNAHKTDTLLMTNYIEVKDCSGTTNKDIQNISIIPNPNNGKFNINCSQDEQYNILVFDLSGQLILETSTKRNNKTIDLTHLNKGVYFLHCHHFKNHFNEKIIIQ